MIKKFIDKLLGTSLGGKGGRPSFGKRQEVGPQEHGIAVAGFDPETPLPKTKSSPREKNNRGTLAGRGPSVTTLTAAAPRRA